MSEKTKSENKKKTNKKTTASDKDKMLRLAGRIVAGAYYDYQEVRKAMMNRIRDIVRKKAEGIPFDEVEKKQDNDKKTFDKKYSDEQLITTLASIKDELTDKEYKYMVKVFNLAVEAKKMENNYKKTMQDYISSEIIYREFLQHIRGVSVILSANLIKEFGYCEKYKYVSSLWKHCGFDVQNGVSPRRQVGMQAKYSPRKKTLGWKIADCMIKHKTPLYYDLYLKYKQKQLEKEYPKGYLASKYNYIKRDGTVVEVYDKKDIKLKQWHAHARAKRYIAKIFFEHYFVACKELSGQDVTEPWIIKHGGHKDYISWKDAVEANKKAKKSLNKKKKNSKKAKNE